MTNAWIIYAVLAAILWGLNYSLAEKLLQSISPITLLALEMLTGSIIFLVISYFMQLKSDLTILFTQPKLLWLTMTEIMVVLIASYFIVVSIHSKNATVAGIIELIYPLFTILFTWLLFNESHVNLPTLLGAMFILVGVIIISFA
jgi:drug/metabolite transporter (DMT)-like permease